MVFIIYDQQGHGVGKADPENREIEAVGEPLKSLLQRYRKEGVPRMRGGEAEETFWDGFDQIKPDDDGFFDAVGEALMWKGYSFKETEEEAPVGD